MTDLSKPIVQKIYKGRKSRSGQTYFTKRLAGVLIGGVVDNEIGIGFSLVHKSDRYDFIKGKREAGFGKTLATNRAVKCATTGKIEVPPSIMKLVKRFAGRCERYYKGAGAPDLCQMEVQYSNSMNTLQVLVEER